MIYSLLKNDETGSFGSEAIKAVYTDEEQLPVPSDGQQLI